MKTIHNGRSVARRANARLKHHLSMWHLPTSRSIPWMVSTLTEASDLAESIFARTPRINCIRVANRGGQIIATFRREVGAMGHSSVGIFRLSQIVEKDCDHGTKHGN